VRFLGGAVVICDVELGEHGVAHGQIST
jgi:hypothetical protein